MGKIPQFTKKQAIVLDALSHNPYITNQGYFTGGTALSSFYLNHRESEDIDIFSKNRWDSQQVFQILSDIVGVSGSITARVIDPVFIYILHFPDGEKLKVDFAQYPYPQIEDSGRRIGDLKVDSLIDIATNKLQTITQRQEVKDFVDLYFLLQKFTFWDLRTAVAEKFRMDIESLLISSDFLAVEDFTFLPRMRTPLTLDELKKFFRSQAVKLAKTVVE